MASRPLKAPYRVITNGDMSLSLASQITIIQNLSMVSYEASWFGSSLDGTISIQVSNSYSQNAAGGEAVAGNWNTILTHTVDSDSDSAFFDIVQTAGYAIRMIYTSNSGTGALNVIVNAKVA